MIRKSLAESARLFYTGKLHIIRRVQKTYIDEVENSL
jgi:hypothetical protein